MDQWWEVLCFLIVAGVMLLALYLHRAPVIEDDEHKRFPGEGYGRRFTDE